MEALNNKQLRELQRIISRMETQRPGFELTRLEDHVLFMLLNKIAAFSKSGPATSKQESDAIYESIILN
jgi:hypothetical protein